MTDGVFAGLWLGLMGSFFLLSLWIFTHPFKYARMSLLYFLGPWRAIGISDVDSKVVGLLKDLADDTRSSAVRGVVRSAWATLTLLPVRVLGGSGLSLSNQAAWIEYILANDDEADGVGGAAGMRAWQDCRRNIRRVSGVSLVLSLTLFCIGMVVLPMELLT